MSDTFDRLKDQKIDTLKAQNRALVEALRHARKCMICAPAKFVKAEDFSRVDNALKFAQEAQ